VPAPGDADAPAEDGAADSGGPAGTAGYLDEPGDDGCWLAGPPAPAWPPLPVTTTQIPPVLGRPPGHPERASPPPGFPAGAGETRRPPPGLLDLTIPWSVLAGTSTSPAWLGRVGPVTTAQALPLADVAALDPHAQWRVILTDPAGHAIAVERVRRRGDPDRRTAGVVGRVTVTIPADTLPRARPGTADDRSIPAADRGVQATSQGIQAAIMRTALRAAARAEQAQAADAAAQGGCAHTTVSASYRPPPRIREYVEARDQTCRQPCCRQPAWRSDLDHTVAWHRGGLTCPCNLGGECRTHHQVKQQPGWKLTQPRPGYFQWTTPAGRTYTTTPDPYPA
jgi:hypothetical protein